MKELILSRFDVEITPTPENIQKMRLLDASIRLRLHGREDDIYLPVIKLQTILRQEWNAFEYIRKNQILYEYQQKRLAEAAITIVRTDKDCAKLIDEIDLILGEKEVQHER